MQNPAPRSSSLEQLKQVPAFYRRTPLFGLPACAAHLGVGEVLLKDETSRSLGSFKSLGGTYAALRALARIAGTDLRDLLSARPRDLPVLVCASDGNHGLAVAAAARYVGTRARVFLHDGVGAARARRIERLGAEIEWLSGTYDDAVTAARKAADEWGVLLIADTSVAADDPVIADVMAGYGILAEEIRSDVARNGWRPPTHAFVQAGVGGLAAAVAEGLCSWMDAPGSIVLVEPERAACVAPAIHAGRAFRIDGDLRTVAEMLSCGEASAPAVDILRRHPVDGISVSEDELLAAPAALRNLGGPATTPSGAAGFAGALAAARGSRPLRYPIGRDSRILLLVTEAPEEATDD